MGQRHRVELSTFLLDSAELVSFQKYQEVCESPNMLHWELKKPSSLDLKIERADESSDW